MKLLSNQVRSGSSQSRPEFQSTAYWWVASWFPDGAQLLADASEMGGHNSIWTISVLGQSPRQLRQGAAGFEVSPDGTHIAFGPSGTSGLHREVWVMGSPGRQPAKGPRGRRKRVAVNWVHWSPRWRALSLQQGTAHFGQLPVFDRNLRPEGGEPHRGNVSRSGPRISRFFVASGRADHLRAGGLAWLKRQQSLADRH